MSIHLAVVQRDERLLDSQMVEQLAGDSGVLAGHQLGRLEGGAGTRRQVAEVPDRSRDDQ